MNLSYPFNLISGKGLGVSYSSLTQIGPALPSRDFGLLPIQSFVNVFTGNLILFDYKCVLPDKNIPLEFYYVYNSHATTVDTIWRLAHKYFKKLPSVSSPLAILVEVDGHETPYQFDSQSNRWQAPYWSESRPYLIQDVSTEQWRWFDPQTQITEVYNQHGCLIERLNRKNESTWYFYSPTETGWRLRKISTLGADYEFRQYFIKGQRYESIHHIYLHKETLLKTSVFDIEGRLLRTYLPQKGLDSTQWPQVNYTYKSPSNHEATQPSQRDVYVLSPLAKIEQNDGSYCSFIYNTLPHFAPRTLAQFNYQDVTDTGIVLANFFYHPGQTIIENYAKVATKLYFNPQGSITQIDRENGYPLTPSHTVDSHYYTYHPSGQLASHTSANQGSEHFYYEQNEGRLIKHEQANGLITEYYYDSTSVKRPLIAMAESDAINGQAQVTRNVYDVAYDRHAQGLYLRFEISPEGRVTEYRLEAPGFVEYTIHYCEARFPVESYPQEKAPNLAEMLTWVAQQDPQKISLTKCQYDNSGQPAHTYYYGMIDEQGKGIEDTQRYHINTRYTLFGDLSQRSEYRETNQNPFRTRQKFDPMRRILFTRNAAQETTTYSYDNKHRRVVITQPNGRQDTTEWDTRGWINKQQQSPQSHSQAITRETTFYRRIVGCSTEKCLTPDGQFSYQFYDKQNRLGVTVDANGRLTEYRYDLQHRYKITLEYVHPIDTEKLAARPLPETEPTINDLFQLMEEMAIAHPEQDRMHYAFYDTAGRLIYEVDPEKYWQQIIYNAWDNVVTKIAYAAPLSLSDLTTLLAGKTLNVSVDPQQDRIQRTLYDHDQQIIGVQDAAGYITEYKRNAAGWMIETIHYGQPQVIDLQTQDFNQIRPPAHPQDTHDYHFYNARGWIILTVDAEGYLSTRDYLLNGLVLSEKYYANPVDTSWYANTTVIPTLPSDSPEDRTIHYEYDVLNREIIRRQSDGKEWFTDYDTMGHVSAQGIRDTHATEINGDTYRATQFQLDGWEQTIAEASVWNSETLAQIEANTHLTAEEKQTQRATIWREQTQRHTYEISGLKVATAMRPSPTADDQLRYFYYDAGRNLALTVQVIDEQEVALHEYTHDVFGNVIKTRDYSQVQSTFRDQFKEALTGGFLSKTLQAALVRLQDDQHDIIITHQYNRRDELIKNIDAAGYETQHLPNAFYKVKQTSLPLQTQQPSLIVQHDYDVRGLETATRRLGATLHLAVQREYQHPKGKLTHLIDEIQGQYQFGYDRKGRPIWKENPRQQRSYTAYDAWDRPINITNTLGQITHYHYETTQRSETIIDPLGHSRIIIKNIFAERIKEINAYQQVRTWQHTADGQVSQYQDALGRGFVSRYNLFGQVTEKHVTNGSVTHYTYDARGQLLAKIEDKLGLQRQTLYHYNHLGYLIRTIDPNSIVIENKYDQRGLVIAQCLDPQKSGLNLMTIKNYNGQRQQIEEILGNAEVSNQYQRQFNYDALSRQCATIVDPITDTHHTALNLVTQQHKNGKDRVITEIDANGHWTRFLFDTSGRHCFTINPLRGVTEWQYNATDQRIVERQYQQPLTEDHVAQLNDNTTPDTLRGLLQPSTEDTITYWFYDANGKPRFILSDTHPNYIIQEKRYDAVQREIKTIQYATPILLPNLAQLTTEQITEYVAKIADATQDRCVYFLYDAAGQIRFAIDPQRCVSEQRFDEQGRLIGQIGYAHPVDDPESLSRRPLSEVLTHLKPSTQDRYQFFYFDHLGQPTYTVHEEGQVVRYQHDAKGNLIEEVHFQQRVEIPQAYSALFAQLQALTPDSTHDRMTQKKYDAANRVIQQTDPLGYTETYQWDALGNRVTYIDRQQSQWKTIFDRANRPILETTPEITFTEVTQEESGLLVSTPRTLAIEKQKQYDAVGNIRRIVSAANTNEPRIFEVAYNGLNQWQKNHLPDIAVDNASPLQPTNWRYRPETKQTLTTTRRMNAKGLHIAEQDAAGHWSFWVYDNQKRLVYKVNSLGVTIKKERDAFGKIHRKTTYATPCSLDLSRYTTTGIPKSVLDSYYRTHTSDQDRVIIMQRDQLGRVILQHQGPTYCYSEHPTRTIHSAYTEIKKTYNPWGQIIAQREKVDHIRQKEQFYWFDRQGQCLAEVDNIGFDSQTPRYRCRRFERNPFKQVVKRVAYAKTLDLVISSDWSFAQLEHTLTGLISPHDRCEEFNYDHADRLIKKTRKQVIRQTLTLTNGLPTVKDNLAQDVSVTYQYNANGQQITKIGEAGGIERSIYDARGCQIAKTDVTRDNHGFSDLITPLTYYGYNAQGQKVSTLRFKQGTQSPITEPIPKPLALDPADPCERQLFNRRGQLIWKQIGQNIPRGFSYTALGKPARQWWILTGWQAQPENQFIPKTDLDEKYFCYDAQNRLIQEEIRRNAQAIETIYTRYDAFGQAIGEGHDPENLAIYRHFDHLGRLWCTNAEKGIPVIYVHDLTGQSILQMRSPTQDLGQIAYSNLPDLLSLSLTDLERTENQRDLGGRVINRSLPANYQTDTSQPQIIPLSILASHRYPKFGKIQSLSWPIPQEKNVQPEFSIWPKDFPEQKQSLTIKTDQGLCGVDISTFATDVYQYEILYYFVTENDPKRLLYTSSGIVQFIADDQKPSQHVVVLTDPEQPSLVRLAGNTQDIQRVELWQEKEKLATFDLQLDLHTQRYFVDLSTMPSGVYQLKPKKKDKTDLPLSLAFTLHTELPAAKPLSREIISQLQLRFLKTYLELNWQVSTFLKKQPVKLQCQYVDAHDQQQVQECEIQADVPRTTYTDKNGQTLQSNVNFQYPIKSINRLSLAIKCPTATTMPRTKTYLSNHWLLLNAPANESSDEESWEMIPSRAANDEKHPKHKATVNDWIPLYQEVPPLLPPTPEPTPFDPEIIYSFNFKEQYLLFITPILLNKTLKTPPVLEYLDISLDRMRCWKQFATLNQTTEGLVVDVMGLTGGIYPFRCQENSGELIVTLGGQVFPTQETIEPDRQHLIQPARRYEYDVWNNKISETDTLGHTTEFRYNDANQLIEKKEPLVEVVDEQGQTQMCSPITTSAYNLCNQLIAKRDANNHTHGFILDAAGHCIIEVLAKGTQRKIQLFDALNTVYETRDGANQRTTYRYDNESNLLVLKQPSGKQQRYTYNEQKQRTSSTDTAHHTHYYNFDPFGNLIERYEPLGQCTRMAYGPYHQMIRLENPDESLLTWQQDAFGKTTQHTDLSGASYQYTYDYKGQVIEVTSKGGDHGSQLNLNVFHNYYEDFYYSYINDVPEQHLRYHYISGQVTQIDDQATGKKTTYRYDSEGRRFAIQVITQQNEIIRETSTQVDALGRETLTQDKQAIFTTGYDAVSNRRFIKAEINLGYTTDRLNQEVWWKYDAEDKVILSEGILKEGQIILTPNQGTEFSYQHDRRITEKKLDTYGEVITATLQYDVDGHLIGTLYSTGEKTERLWTEDRRQQTYKQSEDEKIYRQQDDYYNENGWLLSTTQRQVNQEDPVRIEYKDINPMGLPNKQVICYNDADRNQDHLDYQYVGWDQWRVNKLGGRRHNRHGWSDYSAAQNFFGPNGEQNGILGIKEDKYFETTPDGLILYRINIPPFIQTNVECRTNYVYRINGQYLGSYEHSEQDTHVNLNWVRHRHRNNAGREIGLLKGTHPGQAVSFDPLTENNRHYGDHDAFSSIPKTYICVAGDQYESIAEKIYGDASLASYIEAANGGGTLIAGQTLVIPQLIVVHNKSGMAQPYYQFMQRIQGSFIPYLNTPQPKQSFWEQLLCAVATVVAIVVAPHLAFIASTAAALGVSEAVITGVFVGLVEASAQGLCIGLGLKDHFSFAEALSAGISAGFATHLGFIAPTGDLSAEETLRYILQVGMMNVEEQLVEMAIGIRHQFDLTGVALAMGSAGLSRKIKVDNPWKKRVLTDLSSTAMSSIVRGRFDVESLAIQLIADTTGLVVQEALNKASTSNSSSYQQSQHAGRTAKNWSYTTIDQEWDALLINDAKHVSQLTLPSITLDPDDPHIAYQLGEQVSHFQHPSQNIWDKINNNNYYLEILKEVAIDLLLIPTGGIAIRSILLLRKAARIYELDKKYKALKPLVKEIGPEKKALTRKSEIRGNKMMEENIGYNVSAESNFFKYNQIGQKGTYITDKNSFYGVFFEPPYSAKFRVMISNTDYIKYQYLPRLFWNKSFKELMNEIKLEENEYFVSPLQVRFLEYNLGLFQDSLAKSPELIRLELQGDKNLIKQYLADPKKKAELMGKFRVTKVENIKDRSPRNPTYNDNVNDKYRGPGKGLPGGGPEKIIDSIPTKTWPDTTTQPSLKH